MKQLFVLKGQLNKKCQCDSSHPQSTRCINQPYVVKKAAINRKYKYFCAVLYLCLWESF